MSLTTEAAAAYAAWREQEAARLQAEADARAAAEAAAEAARQAEAAAMVQAAREAVRAVLGVGPDGKQRTLGSFSLTLAYSDVDPVGRTGLVVYSDGAVHLGAQLEAGQQAWRVRLVRFADGAWSAYGDRRIRDLAELGAALAGA